MAARFRRSGTGTVTDHNELINRGIRTHDEIDLYLDELDEARGLNPSLDARFDLIEQKNADQDTKDTAQDQMLTDHGTRLTTAEGTIADHESRLDAVEPKITDLETDLTEVEAELTAARGTYPTLQERIDASSVDPALQQQVSDLETEVQTARGTYPTLNDRLDALPTNTGDPQEVVDARTGIDGTAYTTLDARLDAMEARGGSGGGGGTIGVSDWLESGKNVRSAPQRVFTVPDYTVAQHTLLVIVEGVVMSSAEDYAEVDSTTIRFNYDIPVDHRVIFIGLAAAGAGGAPVEQEVQNDTVYAYNTDLSVQSESIYSIEATPVLLKKTEYTYNSGRVLSETITENGKTYRKTFLYDAAGNVEKVQTRQVI